LSKVTGRRAKALGLVLITSIMFQPVLPARADTSDPFHATVSESDSTVTGNPEVTLSLPQIKERLVASGYLNAIYIDQVIGELKNKLSTTEHDPLLRSRFLDIMYIDVYRALRTLDLLFGFGDAVYFLDKLPASSLKWFKHSAERYPVVRNILTRFWNSEVAKRSAPSFELENNRRVLSLQNSVLNFHVFLRELQERKTQLKARTKVDQSAEAQEAIKQLDAVRTQMEMNLPIYFAEPVHSVIQRRSWFRQSPVGSQEIQMQVVQKSAAFGQEMENIIQGLDQTLRNSESEEAQEAKLSALQNRSRVLGANLMQLQQLKIVDEEMAYAMRDAVRHTILPNIKKELARLDGFDHSNRIRSAMDMRNDRELWLELGRLNGEGLKIVKLFPELFQRAYTNLMKDYARYNADWAWKMWDDLTRNTSPLDVLMAALPFVKTMGAISGGVRLAGTAVATEVVAAAVAPKASLFSKVAAKLEPITSRMAPVARKTRLVPFTAAKSAVVSTAYFQGKALMHEWELMSNRRAAFFSSVMNPSDVSYAELTSMQNIFLRHVVGSIAWTAVMGGLTKGLVWGASHFISMHVPAAAKAISFADPAIKKFLTDNTVRATFYLGIAVLGWNVITALQNFAIEAKVQAKVFGAVNRFIHGGNENVSLRDQLQSQEYYGFTAKTTRRDVKASLGTHNTMVQMARNRIVELKLRPYPDVKLQENEIHLAEEQMKSAMVEMAQTAFEFASLPALKTEAILYSQRMGFDIIYLDEKAVQIEIKVLDRVYSVEYVGR
jgi:hypothetical protein